MPRVTQRALGGDGNTTNGKPRLRFRKYGFTWNNYTRDSIDSLLIKFRDDKFVFQEETGEEGTPHLQGYLEFKNQRSYNELKTLFHGWHVYILDKPLSGEKYAQKDRTRTGSIWTNIMKFKPFKTINDEDLYDWQKKIIEIIKEEPDDRTINWVWEPEGCKGKTALCKYILKNFPLSTYSCASKSADILSIADEDKNIYLLNFTRSQENFAPWSALEQLKDGLISDSKLKKQSRNIIMDSPHIICFANWHPDVSKLSKDRFNIIELV